MTKKKSTTEVAPSITDVRITLAQNGWVITAHYEASRMVVPEMWIANTPQEIGAIMAKHGVKPQYPARKRR